MDKAERSEIGEKIRKHVQNNIEIYFLGIMTGAVGVASMAVGAHEGRVSFLKGFQYGHKAGWSEGYMKSIDWVVEHVMEDGRPIAYIKDGQDYLIDVTLKKTS